MDGSKHDWNKIERLRQQGRTWEYIRQEIGASASAKSLSNQFATWKKGGRKTGSLSLVDFAKEKKLEQKRAICPVCGLDVDARGQLAEAGKRGITRTHQVAWLKEVIGADITVAELQAHFSGRHDG